MAGYERFLFGMEILRYQGWSPQESKREEAKIGKVEWQDMKDSYLVWKSHDTRVGVLQESKREEAKIGKVEWQDMEDSYLVWKSRDTRIGVLHGSKR